MKLIAYIFKGVIRAYQLVITPFLPGTCRYHPTCSQYALESVERFGIFQGFWLMLNRILRCHPWGGYGIDPVPDQPEASSARQFTPHQQPLK